MLCSTNSNGARVRLYRYLPCDQLDTINQEILCWIDLQTWPTELFWNPVDTVDFVRANKTFRTWLLQNNLPVKSIAVTHGVNSHCCGPHTDTPPSRVKLSWPVLNTQHTWNRWFQAAPGANTQINDLGGTQYLEDKDLVEIGRMRVDQPALIRTNVPHDVWCAPEAKFPRWGLQCQLFEEPEL